MVVLDNPHTTCVNMLLITILTEKERVLKLIITLFPINFVKHLIGRIIS